MKRRDFLKWLGLAPAVTAIDVEVEKPKRKNDEPYQMDYNNAVPVEATGVVRAVGTGSLPLLPSIHVVYGQYRSDWKPLHPQPNRFTIDQRVVQYSADGNPFVQIDVVFYWHLLTHDQYRNMVQIVGKESMWWNIQNNQDSFYFYGVSKSIMAELYSEDWAWDVRLIVPAVADFVQIDRGNI